MQRPLESYFTTPSLLRQGSFSSRVGQEHRLCAIGNEVDCYRNLNKAHMYSIRQRHGEFKGCVSGYARAVVLANPTFIVSAPSLARVRASGVRNVHAVVRGTLVGAFESDVLPSALGEWFRLSYSPFLSDQFFRLERDEQGQIVPNSIEPWTHEPMALAILNGKDVFVVHDHLSAGGQ